MTYVGLRRTDTTSKFLVVIEEHLYWKICRNVELFVPTFLLHFPGAATLNFGQCEEQQNNIDLKTDPIHASSVAIERIVGI